MTDNEPQGGNNPEGKPLKLTRPGRLELKKTVESGQVRQSFSHGRTKTVQVEKKKKREKNIGANKGYFSDQLIMKKQISVLYQTRVQNVMKH